MTLSKFTVMRERATGGFIACALASLSLLACATSAVPNDSVAEKAREESRARSNAVGKIGILYLTNRQRLHDKPSPDAYNGNRGANHFGRCEVEFTPIPVVEDVASWVSFHVPSETRVISLAEQTEPSLFWEELNATALRTTSKNVVVFVHGYNYTFERTCRMAAEMQRYLRDQATVVVFSWPSNGSPSDYVRDQSDVEWSVPLLASFIERLGGYIGNDKVQVVAHSLGSRGVILALQRLNIKLTGRPAIGNLVLLAPDFDSASFVDLLPRLTPNASHISLYASANDTPLKISRQLNGYPRLGEAGPYLTVVRGVDTIDVSSVGRYQFTGHEYFYFHPRVTEDLTVLLGTGAPAAERPWLRSRMRNGIRYWEFRPEQGDSASETIPDS